VRLGSPSVTSIGGFVDYTNISDQRFKRNIRENAPGLDFVLKLRPVTYELDRAKIAAFVGSGVEEKIAASGLRQSGFLAQEVEQTVKEMRLDFSGVDAPKSDLDPYGLRYAEFVVPLTKSVQELHALVLEQQKEIAALRQQLEAGGSGSPSAEKKAREEGQLGQNIPNPFAESTKIQALVPQGALGELMVFDLQGQELMRISIPGNGHQTIDLSSEGLSSGMYVYALIVDGQLIESKKMIVKK
jgi:hypothetical protein